MLVFSQRGSYICKLVVGEEFFSPVLHENIMGTVGHLNGCPVHVSHDVRKPVFGFPTRSDTNRVVQTQEMVRGLKFRK